MNLTDPTKSIYDYAEKKHISVRKIIDFTCLTNPFGPSEKAKHAMRKAVREVFLPPDPQARYLRRYIAKKEGIRQEGILFGQGSEQLLGMLLAAVKPKRVLIPAPVPSHYRFMIEKRDAIPVAFSLVAQNSCSVDIERLVGAADAADMLLLPNPHHVLGGLVPAGVIGELGRRLADKETLVVVDEALIEFTQERSAMDLTNNSGNIVVLRSFSLFHSLGGLPLGYLAASPAVIKMTTETCDVGPASTMAASAALASLRDAGFRRRTAECVREEKDYLKGKLGKAGGLEIIDTTCNFLLIRLKTQVSDPEGAFLARNIVVESFADEEGDRFLRLPVRQRRENARFAKTLLRIIA